MIPAEKIIVAIDTHNKDEVRKLLTNLSGKNIWVKVGMELFYSLGPQVIYDAKDFGFNIFLDLKLHDIPTTVEKSLRSLIKLPIDMINVHASGGSEMMKRARDAVHSKSSPPLLIAVTQLTSTSSIQMNEEQNISGDILQSVIHLSKLALKSGCDGVVSSPLEVKSIKEHCGPSFLTVTPGIRPRGHEQQDQQRITTPDEALILGTDYMVIGRPITGAQTPSDALDLIMKGN